MDRARFHSGPAVGKAGCHTDHDRQAQALGQVIGLAGHVVGFLMVGGLEAGDLGELGIEAAVLLVLGAVHAGIVGRADHESALGAGQGRAHEGVGGHVETHMFEGHEGPPAGERTPQGLLESRLFVDRPGGVEGPPSIRDADQVFHDFGGRRPGVGIGPAEPGLDGAEGDGFIAQEDFFGHEGIL